jgi:hypothetical protein
MKNYEEYKTWLSPFYLLSISINIIMSLRRIESANIYRQFDIDDKIYFQAI